MNDTDPRDELTEIEKWQQRRQETAATPDTTAEDLSLAHDDAESQLTRALAIAREALDAKDDITSRIEDYEADALGADKIILAYNADEEKYGTHAARERDALRAHVRHLPREKEEKKLQSTPKNPLTTPSPCATNKPSESNQALTNQKEKHNGNTLQDRSQPHGEGRALHHGQGCGRPEQPG